MLQPQDARSLIKGGAFDSTGYTRKQLMYFVEETPLLEGAAKRQKDRDAGQVSMFDMFADDADSGFQEDVPAPDGVEWDKRTKLAYEKEIMKIYVSEHPLAPFEGTLRRMSRYDMGMLSEQTKEIKNGVFVGMISNVATKLTKRGTKMATFTLEDTTGSIECICFKYDDFARSSRRTSSRRSRASSRAVTAVTRSWPSSWRRWSLTRKMRGRAIWSCGCPRAPSTRTARRT